jgi:hypothetical protein
MVITTLAWNLKAWFALTLPEQPGRHKARRREEKQRVSFRIAPAPNGAVCGPLPAYIPGDGSR